jgi:hypothetical protein
MLAQKKELLKLTRINIAVDEVERPGIEIKLDNYYHPSF